MTRIGRSSATIAVALAVVVMLSCDGTIYLPASGVDAAPPVDAMAGGDATTGDAAIAARCNSDLNCPSESLHCDLSTGTCFECTSDAHCDETFKRCDVALKRCVECGVPADCGPGMTCEPSSRKCIVTCSSTSTCPADTPTCDVVRGVCVACTVASSCADASRPYCENASGRCVACAIDAHCTNQARCDTVTASCVECFTAADCPSERPICEPEDWRCRN